MCVLMVFASWVVFIIFTHSDIHPIIFSSFSFYFAFFFMGIDWLDFSFHANFSPSRLICNKLTSEPLHSSSLSHPGLRSCVCEWFLSQHIFLLRQKSKWQRFCAMKQAYYLFIRPSYWLFWFKYLVSYFCFQTATLVFQFFASYHKLCFGAADAVRFL